MIRAARHNVSILLAFTMLISACGSQRSEQIENVEPEKQVAGEIQPRPEKPEAQENEDKESVGYSPAVVELEGKLSIKTFFGPPNFGENPKTDSKQRDRILSLDKPINVRATDEKDPTLSPSVDNVRELQLILDEPLRKFIGRKVIVKGTLLHAHSGYHHTDVLLDVETISLAPRN